MAPGAVVLRVARHAVHAAVVLVELGAVDGLPASAAGEVLGVPLLVQRCDYLWTKFSVKDRIQIM